MIVSRGITCVRLLNSLSKVNVRQGVQPVRNGHEFFYRRPPDDPPRFNVVVGEILGGFFWWWVLWHLFTEPEHIFGEFEYPDTSKWTDEELGIPAD